MKVHELLFEAETHDGLEQIIAKIKKESKPFLRKAKYPLYRGIEESSTSVKEISPGILKGTVRKDRIPRDSNKDLHKIFDDALFKHFGIRGRTQTLFTSPDSEIADSYGEPYLIFPIGPFKALWSPHVSDVYAELEDNFNSTLEDTTLWKFFKKELKARNLTSSDLDDLDHQERNQIIKKVMDEHANKIYSTNFAKAQSDNNEVMLDTNEYYAISQKLYKEHSDLIDSLFYP